MIDKRKIVNREVISFLDNFPNYSFGEIFYSILCELGADKKSDLLKKTEEEFITAIENAKTKENDQ